MISILSLVVSGIVVQGPNSDHSGWDIACRRGDSVHAVFSGRTAVRRSSRMGNQVTLTGSDGRTAYYAHLDTTKPEGSVKKGDIIGTCGNTGTWSTGNHVHFELH